MSTIDVDAWLAEIDTDAPCGPNLEYDPAFIALEQEALGKPEVQYGATITPAVPPDWKQVRQMAAGLLERSRDLRLVVHLLRADLALFGIEGLVDCLALIERLLEQRWDSVHPALDPDDSLDPTLRINSLAILSDTGGLLRDLKDATLLVLPGLGPLNIKLLEIASGDVAPLTGQAKVATSSIESAIADVAPDQLAASTALLARALASTVNIELALVRHVGSAQALNLDPLTRPLRRAHDFLARQHQASAAPEPEEVPELAPVSGQESAVRAARIEGDIAGREDVLRMLDKLVQYYGRHEPSSPIPILLARARRLVPMNFLEIMQDLAPDGVAQLAAIRGPDATQAAK
ncbi:type VI secretion system protein TssA [Massilia sp. S19_KUP03_FR1]|uniref:type VI secretion system protein TssA n=1 Tax=Massilia sp. S19_KUP03_FR1 TaxID=3025503 RepID=UPI002FCD7338